MRKPIALMLALSALPLVTSCLTTRDLPDRRLARAEKALRDAARARRDAARKYEQAELILSEIAFANPGWRSEKIAARIDECEKALGRLKGQFVGHRETKKVHRVGCRWAQRMKKKNRVYFSSYDEARREGYIPCKVCRPDRPSVSAARAAQERRPPPPGKKPYIAHRDSYKVHRSDCMWAKRIKEENRVYFSSYGAAAKAGYIPCKVCRPDRDAPGPGTGKAPSPAAKSVRTTAPFIGHRITMKVHAADCYWAKKIAPGNRVYFDSYDEAVKDGYVPCKVCKPGAPSIVEKLNSF